MELIHCKSEETFNNICLNEIKKALKPNLTVALSGGSTPSENYKNLANSELDLSNVSFFLADERYIEKNSPDSNQNLIRSTLLTGKAGAKANYIFWNTSKPIEETVKDYAKKLPQQFDLIFLGIGPDGHFASIFPSSEKNSEAKTIQTTTKQFKVKNRLSLSVKTILNAKKIIVLLKNKPDTLNELSKNKFDSEDFPAHLLKSHHNLEIYFI